FWAGAGRCSVGRWHRLRDRDDEVPAVGKIYWTARANPSVFAGQTRVWYPGVVRCRTVRYRLPRTQEENGDWQGRVLHRLRASGISAAAPLTYPRAFVHSLGRLLSLLASRAKESYQVSA